MKRSWLILVIGLMLGSTSGLQAQNKQKKMERALFASGCYWGTEYYLQQQEGVISTTVGYAGGHVVSPSYRQVCTGTTGHAETVEVVFDPEKTDYETLVKIFYETHDPTQVNRQGPDIGEQYRSAIFYLSDEQKEIAERVTNILVEKGYKVATEISKATVFYPEQDDKHQDYYVKTGGIPYCHKYTKKF